MFHLLNMIASGWTSICYSGWFFTANRLKGESNHMLKCTNLMSSARVIMHGRPIQSLVFRFHTRHCPVSLSEAHTEIHTVTCTHKGTHRHTRTQTETYVYTYTLTHSLTTCIQKHKQREYVAQQVRTANSHQPSPSSGGSNNLPLFQASSLITHTHTHTHPDSFSISLSHVCEAILSCPAVRAHLKATSVRSLGDGLSPRYAPQHPLTRWGLPRR